MGRRRFGSARALRVLLKLARGKTPGTSEHTNGHRVLHQWVIPRPCEGARKVATINKGEGRIKTWTLCNGLSGDFIGGGLASPPPPPNPRPPPATQHNRRAGGLGTGDLIVGPPMRQDQRLAAHLMCRSQRPRCSCGACVPPPRSSLRPWRCHRPRLLGWEGLASLSLPARILRTAGGRLSGQRVIVILLPP